MTSLQIYGLSLTSDQPLVTPLLGSLEATTAPDLDICFHPAGPSPFAGQPAEVLYRSPLRTEDSASVSTLSRVDGSPVLSCAGVGDFHLPPGKIEIFPLPEASPAWIELRLLGAVLPFVLESRGVPTLHAATLEHQGSAIGLVSANGGGKTSLAASGLTAGASLLADDLLALYGADGRFLAAPGFPQMRMWPETARHFLPGADLEDFLPGMDKRRVPVGPPGLGRFRRHSTPLAGIYLVDRQPPGSGIEIEPLRPAAALMQLVRHSFTPYVVEALGWQKRRLETFSRLLETVPVKSLRYPGGLDRLPEVVRHLFDDLEA